MMLVFDGFTLLVMIVALGIWAIDGEYNGRTDGRR